MIVSQSHSSKSNIKIQYLRSLVLSEGLPLQKHYFLDSIILKNIRAYSFHGCLTEEGKIGSEYRIDLKVKANLDKPAKTDELIDTVDYVHLNRIVKEEMALRAKLLEHVADRILDRVIKELVLVKKVVVKVSKVNPPLGGDVAQVSVKRSKKREGY